MVLRDGILVGLVHMVDRIPLPPPPAKRPRGHPPVHSHRLLLKALIGMSVRRRYTAWAPLAFLSQDDPWLINCVLWSPSRGARPAGLGTTAGRPAAYPAPGNRWLGAGSGDPPSTLGTPGAGGSPGQYAGAGVGGRLA